MTLRVLILEDHLPTLDGYLYRLSRYSDIQVVAHCSYGSELLPMLRAHPAEVLLFDLRVPVSAADESLFPSLENLPHIVQRYPGLAVLVISAHNEYHYLRTALQAGASGYILKDDHHTLRRLGEIIRSAAHGETFISPRARRRLHQNPAARIAIPLSAREAEILALSAARPAASLADIARMIGYAESTVRTTLSRAYAKLDVPNRAAANAKAVELGIVEPNTPLPHWDD
ncbi:MAG: response regulator [Anaerolineales bacterium]